MLRMVTRATIVGAAVVALSLWACSGAKPCVDCPAIEGAYSVSWLAPDSTNGCPAGARGPQPTSLNFSRGGSTIHTTVGGYDLAGTLYDTFDFTVSGGDDTVAYSMQGRLVPVDPITDAGVRLQGSMTTTKTPTSASSCQVIERYNATKL
jgi:hypothetical protein